MIRYIGVRLELGCRVWRIAEDGKIRALRQSHRSANFPTDAWEWGYGGTGPANLAWALCFDVCEDKEMSTLCHQGVKWLIVSRLAKDSWMLTSAQITDAMDKVGEEEIDDTGDMIDLDCNKPVSQHVQPDPRYPNVDESTL